MAPNVTLLDRVSAVAEHARSHNEVIATIVYMANRGERSKGARGRNLKNVRRKGN